jgi:hypothetical protein
MRRPVRRTDRRPPSSFVGHAGIVADAFYVAILDVMNRPVEVLSPAYQTRMEAMPTWLKTRARRSKIVREVTFRLIEE